MLGKSKYRVDINHVYDVRYGMFNVSVDSNYGINDIDFDSDFGVSAIYDFNHNIMTVTDHMSYDRFMVPCITCDIHDFIGFCSVLSHIAYHANDYTRFTHIDRYAIREHIYNMLCNYTCNYTAISCNDIESVLDIIVHRLECVNENAWSIQDVNCGGIAFNGYYMSVYNETLDNHVDIEFTDLDTIKNEIFNIKDCYSQYVSNHYGWIQIEDNGEINTYYIDSDNTLSDDIFANIKTNNVVSAVFHTSSLDDNESNVHWLVCRECASDGTLVRCDYDMVCDTYNDLEM